MANRGGTSNRSFKLVLVFLTLVSLSTLWVGNRIAYKRPHFLMPVRKLVKLASTYTNKIINPGSIFNASDIYSRVVPIHDVCDIAKYKSWDRRVITAVQPVVARDCQLLRQGDLNETRRVQADLKNWKDVYGSFQQWSPTLQNCSNILNEFSNNFYVSQEELDFPLAFTFIIHSHAAQVVRLLKAIYRPHNIYCIHPDNKQPAEFINAFRTISRCVGNIFVASKLENVYYHSGISIVRAQLNCLENLLELPEARWRYAINICGTELPLKTNRQIVRTLREMNGVSSLSATERISSTTKLNRFTYVSIFDKQRNRNVKSSQLLPPPPHNISLYKSLSYIAASRVFANFTLNSKIASDFLEFLSKAKTAEEHFYASLYFHPNVPGGYNESVVAPIVERVMWMYNRDQSLCHGEVVRGVCIVTVGDLPEVYRLGVGPVKQVNFFFNKYLMDSDHVVMDCLEEELLKRNYLEFSADCQH